MTHQLHRVDWRGIPRASGVPYANEGNLPIGVLSTAEKLNNSVGDEVEENVYPVHSNPELRRQLHATLLLERHAYDGARGQIRRMRHLAAGGYPVVSGDRVPTVLLNPDSNSAQRGLLQGYNATALRRSVINRDSLTL